MGDVKHTPVFARPMDLHSHTEGCDDKRADGSTYCNPVYAAADYESLLRDHARLSRECEELRAALNALYGSRNSFDPAVYEHTLIVLKHETECRKEAVEQARAALSASTATEGERG